ncbi:hypothetical protein [Haloarcula sp. 1CSR25-25]|uniref:hypothetical protein n=1 Tax=Haloarcula sp. 1CSR25-25 TaxID=2862545 RepID=UPI00289B650C|nr:hypothetical protein [Haloarcula sp. 1CSR25-25]
MAEEISSETWQYIMWLLRAQMVKQSRLRTGWLNTLMRIQTSISEAKSDREVEGRRNALTDVVNSIFRNVDMFHEEWASVKERYFNERQTLSSVALQSIDAEEAMHILDKEYEKVTARLDDDVLAFLTDEDYNELRWMLDSGSHIRDGRIRGARIRVKKLEEMLDVVVDLRKSGNDADMHVPGWENLVLEEIAHLDRFANEESGGKGVFSSLQRSLVRSFLRARAAGPPERSTLEKMGLVAKGGVRAVVDPLVETGKQAVDLAQIALHFATKDLTHGMWAYEPTLISGTSEAVNQGAGTSDILGGMVTGPLETPERLVQAIEDEDWEAVGGEGVNMVAVGRAIRRGPRTATNALNLSKALGRRWVSKLSKARETAIGMQSEVRLSTTPLPEVTPSSPTLPTPLVPDHPSTPARSSAPTGGRTGGGSSGTPTRAGRARTPAQAASDFAARFDGRLVDDSGLAGIFTKIRLLTERSQDIARRAAAGELKTIVDILRDERVTRLRVVPETNVQRTPDLVLEFGDGTTTRVEIRTFTAAAKVKTGQEPTVSLRAATKLRSRPITKSELKGNIKNKAKTTSSRFSQLDAPMEGVPVGGSIAIVSHHKTVSPAVADAAMAELTPGLGPHVHSVTITTPSGTGAGRITLVYHRDGATFVRQP